MTLVLANNPNETKREETRREVRFWKGGSASEGLAVGSSGLIEVGCWIILSGRDRSGNTAGVRLHKLKALTHTHTHRPEDWPLLQPVEGNSDYSSEPMTQVYLWLSSFFLSTNINTVSSGNCWQLWRSHRVKKKKMYWVKKSEGRNTPQRALEKVWKRQTRRSVTSALRNKSRETLKGLQSILLHRFIIRCHKIRCIWSNYNTLHYL